MDSIPSLYRCTKCGNEYPRTPEYFYKDAQKADGLRPDCKQCNNTKKQSWRDTNPDKSLEAGRRQRANMTPQQRERKREGARKLSLAKYYADLEGASERYKKYYQDNRDYHRARKRDYELNHPEVRRAADKRNANTPAGIAKRHRRIARKKGLPDTFRSSDWQYALGYFQGKCAVCGAMVSEQLTIVPDHWIPLASPDCPGTIPSNIIPLCHSKKDGHGGCNNEKHHRDPDEWLATKYGTEMAKQILQRIGAYLNSLK